MGLFEKMKNLFTDEYEEEPIKSEVRQVEIPAPAKKETEVSEKVETPTVEPKKIETPKVEEKTPIFFDDDYFKELEQPKKEIKSTYLKEQTKLKEEKKQFRPTPIISPIYGVLDKNYNKEDITSKKVLRTSYTNTNITIDDVRNKAYGTLEDDLESSLFQEEFQEDNSDLSEDLFKELSDKPIKEEEPINIIEDDNLVEDELNKMDKKESSLEKDSELFDLIDSMYERKE